MLASPSATAFYSGTKQSAISFYTPVNLSNDSSKATYPWVANVGSNVYVAWSEGSRGLMFRASMDGGTTWNPPLSSPAMKLSLLPGVTQAPIVCASGSDVYTSWSQTVGTTGLQVFVASSNSSGLHFGSAMQLSSGSPARGWITPVCAVSGPNAYVAWINGSPNQSWVSFSNNNGGSWSIPFHYGFSREPEGAAVGNYSYIYSNRNLMVSKDGGASWTRALYNRTLLGDEGQISASGPYVFLATQTKTSTGYIHLYYSSNYGKSFHSVNDSTPTLPNSWEPMVASYGMSAWIAVVDYPGGSKAQIYVYSTSNGGKNWSAPVSISGTGHDDNYPFTVSSSDGQNVFVGFTQENKTGYWIFKVGYSPDGGATWSSPPGIDVSQNSNGAAGFQNDLATGAISSFGSHCYATWEYVNGTTVQVYFSHS